MACAEALDTEIISADSMQVYRGMPIGTAAPTAEDCARVPHHFVGCREPASHWSAGMFEAAASAVVRTLNARGKPVVVAGGSGLYVQALLNGIFSGPPGSEAFRKQLHTEHLAGKDLYARLLAVDPTYATAIDPNDLRRVIRGLEVFEVSGRTLSDLHAEHQAQRPSFRSVQVAIDWPRETLYRRVEERVDAMLAAGFVEEVRALLDDGHGPALRKLRAVGYGPVLEHLEGDLVASDMVALIKRDTRRFAKRQLTWFRADPRVEWITPPTPDSWEALVEYTMRKAYICSDAPG